MVKGVVVDHYDPKKVLNIDNILKKITPYDIFKFYTPHSFTLNQSFKSPFRKDEKPSFQIKQSKTSDTIYWLDYSNDDSGNCFQYVQKIYNIDFNQALQKINSDFGLGLSGGEEKDYKRIVEKYQQPEKVKIYKRFDVFVRPFLQSEMKLYWNLRFLSRDELKLGQIYSYSKLLIDGKQIDKPTDLSFAFYYPSIDAWKIYSPYANKAKGEYKWLTNVPLDHVEGLPLLKKNKISIGCKSRKDTLITRKFIPECYELQNESEGSLNQENIYFVKENSNKQYLWFDNDDPGVRSCKFYNQFGLDYVNLPKETFTKDQDEFVIKYGLNKFEEFLKQKQLI